MRKVPHPSAPLLSLLHALHPPGNLAAKVSVAAAGGPEAFGLVLRGDPNEAAAAVDELLATGQLIDSGGPGAWAYRIVHEGTHALGLVAAVDRRGGGSPSPLATARGFEPAIATVRARMSAALLELVRAATTERPLFHFKATDGVTHTGWTIADSGAVAAELANLPGVEIDGTAPERCVGLILLPETPAFAPRLGLFVRKLGSPAAARP